MLVQKAVNTKDYAYDIVDQLLMNIMLKTLKVDVVQRELVQNANDYDAKNAKSF